MWLKLFFLLLYFLVLFVLARVFEAVVWYETGIFATQLVDPVTLSFKKLKTILECRGLGYSGLAEKRDVRELVEKSGDLMQGELYSAIKNEEQQVQSDSSTSFSGEMHFYELVEDTKDGIWLVQVIAQDRDALLSKANWGKMVQKVSQFGIRTGTFNCSNDPRYCRKRGWVKSTLIMSVPQTYSSKGKVMLREYDGRRIETEHIFKWMTAHVASRIKTLRRPDQLAEEWRPSQSHPIKMFLFARLATPPAFFSALSVKFTGRIEFIFVDVRHWGAANASGGLREAWGVARAPSYVLKMPEGTYRYGNSTGEFISLAAMDTFLRSVQPEVNDVFVLSLVMVNLLAWMDLFVTQGASVKRFVVLISTLGTYNSLLLLSWLPVLALLQLPYLEAFYACSLKLLRYADTTRLASWVRADWTFYSSHPALFLSTYLAHGLLVDYFERKRRCANEEQSPNNLEWLCGLWDWYSSYLVHPMASRQHLHEQSDWDEDPHFLLERLAFPDLWLRPLVPIDYIKDLPTWRFRTNRACRRDGGGAGVGDADTRTLDGAELERGWTGPSQDRNGLGLSQAQAQNQAQNQTQDTTALSQAQTQDTTALSQRQIQSQHQFQTQHQLQTQHQFQTQHQGSDSESDECSGAVPCGHRGDPGEEPCKKREEQKADWCQWPADMLRCTECVVCLETFETDFLVMGLPCGHVFHQQCIVVWLAGGRHCCPVCRWPPYKKKPGAEPLEREEQ